MESNVILVHISNGHNKLLPFISRFMVSSYCSLFLLVTINPRCLIRSPLKGGNRTVKPKAHGWTKGDSTGRQDLGTFLEAIISAYVASGNYTEWLIRKGDVIMRTWGVLQKQDMIELDLERTRNNKYKSISIPSLTPVSAASLSHLFILVILPLLTHLVEFTLHEDELYKIESQPQGRF